MKSYFQPFCPPSPARPIFLPAPPSLLASILQLPSLHSSGRSAGAKHPLNRRWLSRKGVHRSPAGHMTNAMSSQACQPENEVCRIAVWGCRCINLAVVWLNRNGRVVRRPEPRGFCFIQLKMSPHLKTICTKTHVPGRQYQHSKQLTVAHRMTLPLATVMTFLTMVTLVLASLS